MKRALLPAGIAVVLALSSCGSDAPKDTGTARAATPTTAATTSAAAPDVAATFRGTGYAFDVPPGSWSERRVEGRGAGTRRQFVDAAGGTEIDVQRRVVRPGGETSRSAAKSLRSTFLKDGASGGSLRSTTLDGERATLLSLASPGPETRPYTAIVAVRGGHVYTALVVGPDPPTSASFQVGAKMLTSWRWT